MYGKNSSIQQQGFSLIELIVVVGIISILLSIAWFQFSAYTRKTQIESQTNTLYGDLMEARTKALYEKKIMTFQFTGNSYTISADGVLLSTRNLSYPITSNNTDTVVWGTNGMAPNPASQKTICLSQSNEATVDAVIIYSTRVQIGKKNEGAACAAANVTAK